MPASISDRSSTLKLSTALLAAGAAGLLALTIASCGADRISGEAPVEALREYLILEEARRQVVPHRERLSLYAEWRNAAFATMEEPEAALQAPVIDALLVEDARRAAEGLDPRVLLGLDAEAETMLALSIAEHTQDPARRMIEDGYRRAKIRFAYADGDLAFDTIERDELSGHSERVLVEALEGWLEDLLLDAHADDAHPDEITLSRDELGPWALRYERAAATLRINPNFLALLDAAAHEIRAQRQLAVVDANANTDSADAASTASAGEGDSPVGQVRQAIHNRTARRGGALGDCTCACNDDEDASDGKVDRVTGCQILCSGSDCSCDCAMAEEDGFDEHLCSCSALTATSVEEGIQRVALSAPSVLAILAPALLLWGVRRRS